MNISKNLLALGPVLSVLLIASASAEVTNRGISPASNTWRFFNDSSLTRDSELNEVLDLLDDFYPSIEVEYSDHDNVRHRSDLDEADAKWTIRPSLAYRTDLGRHKFYASYDGVFTRHDDFDSEDSEANLFNAKLGLDINKRFDLNLFAGTGETFEERGVSGSRGFNQLIDVLDSKPDVIDIEFYGADLIYGRKFSRLNATVGFDKNKIEFDNNFQGIGNFTGNRDREADSVHLDVSYQVGGKTSIFGRVRKTDVDYTRTFATLDSEETAYLIGVRWKPTNSLSGVVGVGNTEKDFDDPAREDYDDTSYYINLQYSLSPFSVISLNASQFVEEPGDDQSDFYESQLLGLSWSHALSERLSFGVYGKLIDDDFNNGRKDEFTDIGASFDYILRRWLTLGLYYGEIDRESNDSTIPYTDEYFGLRLRSDLRKID